MAGYDIVLHPTIYILHPTSSILPIYSYLGSLAPPSHSHRTIILPNKKRWQHLTLVNSVTCFTFTHLAPFHIGLVEHTVTPDQGMRANCPFIRYATLGKLSPFWSRKTPNKENAMNATPMPITCLKIHD